MDYRIIPTPQFQREVKYLKKKYRHIVSDLEDLNKLLAENPSCGDPIEGLGGKIFKMRFASSDTKKGKSKGYRIIYYYIGLHK